MFEYFLTFSTFFDLCLFLPMQAGAVARQQQHLQLQHMLHANASHAQYISTSKISLTSISFLRFASIQHQLKGTAIHYFTFILVNH